MTVVAAPAPSSLPSKPAASATDSHTALAYAAFDLADELVLTTSAASGRPDPSSLLRSWAAQALPNARGAVPVVATSLASLSTPHGHLHAAHHRSIRSVHVPFESALHAVALIHASFQDAEADTASSTLPVTVVHVALPPASVAPAALTQLLLPVTDLAVGILVSRSASQTRANAILAFAAAAASGRPFLHIYTAHGSDASGTAIAIESVPALPLQAQDPAKIRSVVDSLAASPASPASPAPTPAADAAATPDALADDAKPKSVSAAKSIAAAASEARANSHSLLLGALHSAAAAITADLAIPNIAPFEIAAGSSATPSVLIAALGGLHSSASAALFATHDNVAVLNIAAFAPWDRNALLTALPPTVAKIIVVERSGPGIDFGPLFGQLSLSLLEAGSAIRPIEMVTIEQAVADAASDPLAASLAFLLPSVAAPAAGIPRQPESVSAVSPSATSVVDILGSLFGDQLRVFGKDSAFTSPDVAFGNLVADSKNRQDLADAVTHALGVSGLPAALKDSLAQWTESRLKANARSNSEAAARLSTLLESQSSIESMVPAARNAVRALANKRDLLAPASRWLVDVDTLVSIDSSAIHQIVASGENMNVLAITSTPFDPTAAAGPRVERDVGLYAMNYGGAYVASICPSYSYAQAVQALREADAFRGPSIVIAYVPNPQLLRGFAKSALGVVNNVQSAINAGLWTLYRWHPFGGKAATAGEPAFTLDSSKIKNDIEQFLDRNAQLSLLVEPELTPAYLEPSLDKQIQKRVESQVQRSYDALFATLDRKSLLVLFGSDGGNGEALAKRIAHEAKEKGLYVQVMAADAFVAEDLERQERVLFVVSTAGQGEFPGNIRETWKFLSAASAPRLESLNYAVFALGDRHYWPRPEDAHFFAKAGKDLDARLAVLGASRLTHLGIGDDRDPDGLYTGFNAWVPGFWTALGVAADPVAAEANVPSDDAIKLASNYLRGTIAEGLVDTSTGALAEYDTKLTKFHGIYQQDDRDLREGLARRGLEKAFSFMVRIRVPGGVATTAQWLAMNDIADRLANGTIKITTRQAFQFHGIVKSNLKQSIQEINRALMDTIAACGDVNRNVMCNPNPVDSAVHKEVLDFSRRLSAHMTPQTSAYHEIWLDKKLVATFGNEEPMYGKTYLPRKFKVAVAVPPYNDVDVFAHDLGYIAIVHDGRLLGFNVTVGGGMGQTHGNKKTYPMLAQPLGFCTVEQAVDVGEKVLLVQRDYGDRTNRRHARLKYTIEDRGLEWFRGQVEERLGYKLEAPQPYTFTTNGDRYGWTRGTDGLWAYTLFVANGRVKDTPEYRLKSGLAELAAVHRGTLALTPNQHLVVAGITDDQRPVIQRVLDRYSLSNAGLSGLRLGSMACVALPTCALAMAESERYLPSLVDKIEDTLDGMGMRSEAVTIRMTGCPNGCARPQLAEIGFIGKAPGMYNMYLGGGFAGERLSMLYKESVDEDAIMAELGLLLGRWSRERLGDEHFGDYCVRVGVVKPEVRKVTV